jgi:hypothetical protein
MKQLGTVVFSKTLPCLWGTKSIVRQTKHKKKHQLTVSGRPQELQEIRTGLNPVNDTSQPSEMPNRKLPLSERVQEEVPEEMLIRVTKQQWEKAGVHRRTPKSKARAW